MITRARAACESYAGAASASRSTGRKPRTRGSALSRGTRVPWYRCRSFAHDADVGKLMIDGRPAFFDSGLGRTAPVGPKVTVGDERQSLGGFDNYCQRSESAAPTRRSSSLPPTATERLALCLFLSQARLLFIAPACSICDTNGSAAPDLGRRSDCG